jgi:hypothetical protein
VTRSAAPVEPELLRWIDQHDDETVPLAELARRVGTEADRLGMTRPSYERIRQLIHDSRFRKSLRPGGVRAAAQQYLEESLRGELTNAGKERILRAMSEPRPRK